MQMTIEVTKCKECPYFKEWYEFGEYTTYCNHKNANRDINGTAAYEHIGQDRIPRDSISLYCPMR